MILTFSPQMFWALAHIPLLRLDEQWYHQEFHLRPGRFSTHFPYAVKKLSKEEYLKITTFCQNFIYFLFSNYLIQIVLRLDDPWYPQKISRWDFRFSTHISYGVKSLPKLKNFTQKFRTKS